MQFVKDMTRLGSKLENRRTVGIFLLKEYSIYIFWNALKFMSFFSSFIKLEIISPYSVSLLSFRISLCMFHKRNKVESFWHKMSVSK